MATETIQLQEAPESGRFDKRASKLVLWVSYMHTWTDNYGNSRNNQNYYLKFKTEKKDTYDGVGTELQRAFQLIEDNYKAGRKFKTIVLYQNWNCGGTHKDKTIKNPEVFKIVNKADNLEFELPEIKGDNGNAEKYIKEKFERINQIHHSV